MDSLSRRRCPFGPPRPVWQPGNIPGREAMFYGRVREALRQTVPYLTPYKTDNRVVYDVYGRHVAGLVAAIQMMPDTERLSLVFRSIAISMLNTEALPVLSPLAQGRMQTQREEALDELLKEGRSEDVFAVKNARGSTPVWMFSDTRLSHKQRLECITYFHNSYWRVMPLKARIGLTCLLRREVDVLLHDIGNFQGKEAITRFVQTLYPVLPVLNHDVRTQTFIHDRNRVSTLIANIMKEFLASQPPGEMSRTSTVYYKSLIEECARFHFMIKDDKTTLTGLLYKAAKPAFPGQEEAEKKLVCEVKRLLAQGEGALAMDIAKPCLIQEEGGMTPETFNLIEQFRKAIRVVVADLCLGASELGLRENVRGEIRQLLTNLGGFMEPSAVIGLGNFTLLTLLRGISKLPDKGRGQKQ